MVSLRVRITDGTQYGSTKTVRQPRVPAAVNAVSATATSVPAPTPTAITFDFLIGTWRLTEVGWYQQWNADGTYRGAFSIGALETTPEDVGTFTLEGTLITFTTEGCICKAGDRDIWELELVDENRIRQVLQERGGCEYNFGRTFHTLERVP